MHYNTNIISLSIFNFNLCYSCLTSEDIKRKISTELNVRIHNSTVRKHRKALGFEACVPNKVPFIRDANQQKRLEFCTILQETRDTFDDVIFTDETTVQVKMLSFHLELKKKEYTKLPDNATILALNTSGPYIMDTKFPI